MRGFFKKYKMTVARPIPSARSDRPQLGSHSPEVLGLDWLPVAEGFETAIRRLRREVDLERRLATLIALAHTRLDFLQSTMLDRELLRLEADVGDEVHAHL